MFENRNELKEGVAFNVIKKTNGKIDYIMSETGKYVVVRTAISNDAKYIVVECKAHQTNRPNGDGHE